MTYNEKMEILKFELPRSQETVNTNIANIYTITLELAKLLGVEISMGASGLSVTPGKSKLQEDWSISESNRLKTDITQNYLKATLEWLQEFYDKSSLEINRLVYHPKPYSGTSGASRISSWTGIHGNPPTNSVTPWSAEGVSGIKGNLDPPGVQTNRHPDDKGVANPIESPGFHGVNISENKI